MKKNHLLAWLLFATVAGYWIAQAGSLEPPAAPGPTMQPLDALDTKMDGIPSAWYRAGFDPLRFQIVMNGEAALDTETGLVWERVPDPVVKNWYTAVTHCLDRVVDNRMGWRLPAVQEVLSLVDPSQSSPALPANHPFTIPAGGGAGPIIFWTMSSRSLDGGPHPPDWAHLVTIDTGSRFSDAKVVTGRYAWCVRGGAGYDGGHG